ncbi:MAG: PAS domain S-box protein [Deltaproteobacteria bacterium]|nr:PAS domain S-box protein [Deltaproteobacteria bacterium]
MNEEKPLYNSRLVKNYIEYLAIQRPDVDADALLEYAGIRKYEMADPGCWFTQNQADRFHEILALKTGDPNISREAGRFSASTSASNPLKKYALGFVTPHAAYRLVTNISTHLTRSANLSARKLGKSSVEVTATPNPGITERPYQCENRTGMLEALAKIFTGRLARIEHPECMHGNGKVCRYIVTWDQMPSLAWKLRSKYAALVTIIFVTSFFFLLPETEWAIFSVSSALVTLFASLYAQWMEKRELARVVEIQGDVARERIEEIDLHYSHAQLVQEIGQATSKILNEESLMKAVSEAMKRHLKFDRGLLMLADKERRKLIYKAGYGYEEEQEQILRSAEFSLRNPRSRGLFARAFSERTPFLLEDVFKESEGLLGRNQGLARQMGVQSLICVPIVYEDEALGLIAADNIKSSRPLTRTDLGLLTGVASQIALSVVNARSFRRLQESESKYRELVENANSIIVRLDTEGNVLFFNEFAQRFFGYSEEEVLGRNMAGTILAGDRGGKRDLVAMIGDVGLQPERRTTQEIEHRKHSGEQVWVAWTRKAIRDEGGNLAGVLCIGNDITHLKVAAEEKRDLELRLQRAQKMEAIGTLAGGVAHDLNNILSGLVSYPELLLMDLPPESPLVKPLMTIKKSGEKAAGIVQDLLTLARRGVSTVEVVGLNRVILDYLRSPEFMSLKLEHPELRVETSLAEDLFNVAGSGVHLSKTLMNLVRNAAEAMPSGGVVRITTANRYVDRPIRGYDDVEEGNYVVLIVSDSGVGIPPQDLERIFEPFYTKKVMGRSGTGLGMAVVWGTVKDHHGYIDVQSEEGRGTVFTLYFPVTMSPMAETPVSLSVEEYRGRGETVLVVDDVPEQRDLASMLLRRLGYRVASVSSGEEAVEYLKVNSVDLLLLDMIMSPGMDGLDTYRAIAELHPGQKAVIVSGFSETGRVREAQRLGVGGYIKKPYAIESIGMAVRKELNRP